MDRVFFEGIRCFYSRQEVPLAPVTILVGENSSGKSTALALTRLAWDVAMQTTERPAIIDFNEPPFFLGSYKQVASAHSHWGETGITLGLDWDNARLASKFENHRGQAILSKQVFESQGYKVFLQFDSDGRLGHIRCQGFRTTEHKGIIGFLSMEEGARRSLENFQDTLGERPYAFAPIRSRPRRTYDPVLGQLSPEGDHVPMLLASLSWSMSEGWHSIVSAMDSFGHASGLFDVVGVRSLATGEGDPFQVQVRIGGRSVNLIDAGYGVSQVLPIVFDCLRGENFRTYLLQQPEVHLHPRAQAELGSFLAVLAKQQNKRFVIETHSDYLVDRIRMDIRDKKGITPEDVALLYFERKNGEATIHRLELDDEGNILNAPPGYRSFFLEEERRFLGG